MMAFMSCSISSMVSPSSRKPRNSAISCTFSPEFNPASGSSSINSFGAVETAMATPRIFRVPPGRSAAGVSARRPHARTAPQGIGGAGVGLLFAAGGFQVQHPRQPEAMVLRLAITRFSRAVRLA